MKGVLQEGSRVPALRGNRLLYKDGTPAAVLQAGELHFAPWLGAEARELAARALRLQPVALRGAALSELPFPGA